MSPTSLFGLKERVVIEVRDKKTGRLKLKKQVKEGKETILYDENKEEK